MPESLTLRQLSRALLDRQLLLTRADLGAEAATSRVAGLQSQVPNPPYIGLWSRLSDFERADLTDAIRERRIVRAALMRSTLQLVTAADHALFRPTLLPALEKGLRSFFGKRIDGLDKEPVIEAARAHLDGSARTKGELKPALLAVAPDRDPEALSYVVRTYLPLIQAYPSGTWGSGAPTYERAEARLGPLGEPNVPALFRRYLAAFGPASIMDFQTWSGMTKMQETLADSLIDLVQYKDEQGRTLYDLPDNALPHADTPAPVRFVPEYDNLLISHADRSRIIADADRGRVFLSAGRIAATVLIDGFVAGTWKVVNTKRDAVLEIELFGKASSGVESAMHEEGGRLVRFIADTAETTNVRIRVVS
ncbi:MAG: AlkZ family DNA glycosylase [Chloroflexi bacterium]|nr:AlkZ family DNA glycosylase [Chloroflexota bacterium]